MPCCRVFTSFSSRVARLQAAAALRVEPIPAVLNEAADQTGSVPLAQGSPESGSGKRDTRSRWLRRRLGECNRAHLRTLLAFHDPNANPCALRELR